MIALHRELSGPTSAPVVVLSHALGATLAVWDAQEPALAARFRVLRYDLRGHGASALPTGPVTLADLGGDVVDLLDELGSERASLVTPPEHGRAIADRIRGANLLVLGHAAHLANVEQPAAFNRAMLAHLEDAS